MSHLLPAFSSECLLEPSPPFLTLLKEFQNTITLNTCYLFEQRIRKRQRSTVTQGRPCNVGHTRKEIRLQCSPCLRSEDPDSPSPDPKVFSLDAWRVSQLQITTHSQGSFTCFAILYHVFIGRFEADLKRKSKKTERAGMKGLCPLTHSCLHPTASLLSPAISSTNKQTNKHYPTDLIVSKAH